MDLPLHSSFGSSKYYFMVFKNSNVSLCVLLVVGVAGAAEAQAPLGTRAAGMAGAFVGVADDASAVYWNPAGLATGAIVSFLVTFSEEISAPDDAQAAAGERHTGRMVALSLPPIGLAYYRIGAYGTSVAPPAVTGPSSREEVRRSVQALTTSMVGVSLLQSLTDHIVVGATPKLVRGPGDTGFDVDAGVMIAVERIRVGLVARNLTTPAFAKASASARATADETAGRPGEDGGEIELSREVRAGVAWGSQWPGNSRLTVSMDADVTARVTPFGDRRDIAAGLETWSPDRRLSVRGGLRRSTIGAARTAVAGGASWAVRPTMFVEGHVTAGEMSERGWSIGIRMGF